MATAVSLDDMDRTKAKRPIKIKKPVKKSDKPKGKAAVEKTTTLPAERPSKDDKKPEWLEARKKKKEKALSNTKDDIESLDAQFVEVLSSLPESMQQENEQIAEYQRMFGKLKRLARMTEKQILGNKSTRGIYPLMQVYREMREVIADMRALKDVGQLGSVLNEEVLTPFAQASAGALVTLHQGMLAAIKTHCPTDAMPYMINAADSLVRQAATEVQTSYAKSLERTIQVFNSGG